MITTRFWEDRGSSVVWTKKAPNTRAVSKKGSPRLAAAEADGSHPRSRSALVRSRREIDSLARRTKREVDSTLTLDTLARRLLFAVVCQVGKLHIITTKLSTLNPHFSKGPIMTQTSLKLFVTINLCDTWIFVWN